MDAQRFVIHRTEEDGFGYQITSLAGIFTVELTALFVTLWHVNDVIQLPFNWYFFLTDSLSSVKAMLSRKISHRTHSLVYECKQMCSGLFWNGVEVVIMWISSNVELEGNEVVDMQHLIFDIPLPPVHFQGLARSVLLKKWQG
jgi:hypothetical protein